MPVTAPVPQPAPPACRPREGARLLALVKHPAARSVVALGGAIACVLAFFRAPLFEDLQFYQGDTHALLFPVKELIASELAGGRLPLWDPHSLCGYGILSSYIGGVFLPQNVLLVLLPFGLAFKVLVVSKHVLAAVFQFLLLRTLGLPRTASAAGAAVFALSGPLVSLSSLHAFSFECLPLAVWLWWRVLEAPARPGARLEAWTASVLGFAFVFLHGDLQTVYTCGLLALILPLGARRIDWRGLRRSTLLLAVAAPATILLSAVQFLPSLDALLRSERSALPAGERLLHSLDPGRLADLVLPPTAGGAHAGDVFVGLPYLGGVAALLAVFGVTLGWRRGASARRLSVLVAAVLVVAVLLALGKHFPLLEPLGSVLPGLRIFRYPEKWLGLGAFAASILAALGLTELLRRRLRPLGVAFAAVAVADLFFAASPFLEERLVDGSAYDAEHLLDLEDEVPGFRPSDRLLRLPTNGVMEGIRPIERDPTISPRATFRREMGRLVAWNTRTLAGNTASRAGLRRVSGITSFRVRTVERMWAEAARRDRVPLLVDLLAARWVLTSTADRERFQSMHEARGVLEGSERVASLSTSLGDLEVYRRPSALDRVLVLPRVVLAGDDDAAFRRLFAPEFDPSREMVAVGTPSPPVSPGTALPGEDAAGAATAKLVEDAPTRLSIDVEVPWRDGGYLLVNDTYDPGWSARIDGSSTEVFRANAFARGIAVPCGRSHVELTYAPRGLQLGAVLSLLSSLVAIGALIAARAARRGAAPRSAQSSRA